MANDVETYFEYGAWRNWSDGKDLGEPHASREEAVAEGRRTAGERRVQHIVRDEHGSVVERVRHD